MAPPIINNMIPSILMTEAADVPPDLVEPAAPPARPLPPPDDDPLDPDDVPPLDELEPPLELPLEPPPELPLEPPLELPLEPPRWTRVLVVASNRGIFMAETRHETETSFRMDKENEKEE
ncbi:MAG: hypothetical protein Q9201_001508 [Fulgogasparrea decipioides]